MAGLTMIDGTYMPEIIGSQMASPYLQIEMDEYGIGYTPFFYCTAMVRDLMKVNMLSIDSVVPSKESLKIIPTLCIKHLCCNSRDGKPREYSTQTFPVHLYEKWCGYD